MAERKVAINMRVPRQLLADIDQACAYTYKTRTALMLEAATTEALRVLAKNDGSRV